MRIQVILLVAACGGRATTPKPAPLDPAGLARLLDDDFVRLGDIAHRLRGKCTETTAELRPHIARMQQHHADVDRMLQDAKQTIELKKQLAAFAARVSGTSDQIAQDLGATYGACKQSCVPDAAIPPPPQEGGNAPVMPPPQEGEDAPVRPPPTKPARGHQPPPCAAAYQLERAIADMPTY